MTGARGDAGSGSGSDPSGRAYRHHGAPGSIARNRTGRETLGFARIRVHVRLLPARSGVASDHTTSTMDATERGRTPTDQPRRVLWCIKGLGSGGAEQLLVSSARGATPGLAAYRVAYLLPWKDALVPRSKRPGSPPPASVPAVPGTSAGWSACAASCAPAPSTWCTPTRRSLPRAHDVVVRTLPRAERPAGHHDGAQCLVESPAADPVRERVRRSVSTT